MIKQIILQVGRKIIDFFAWFELIILSLCLVAGLFFIWLSEFEVYLKITYTVGAILITLFLFLISVMLKYFTYLFIDIRDNTAKIAQVNEETEELNKKISAILRGFGITLLCTCIIGLILSGVAYLQKTLNNQEDNFTIISLKKEISNGKTKYLETMKSEKFGFSYNTDNTKQLKIAAIFPNSAADKAGLKVNDVFLKVNNYDVSNGYDVKKFAKLTQNVKKLDIDYIRNGEKKNVVLERVPFEVDNFAKQYKNSGYPLTYLNSMNFKNDYISIFYKVYTNPSKDEYVKKGLVCNCKDSNRKAVTLFWYGNYVGDRLIDSTDLLSNNSAYEEVVYPNTEGGLIWQAACEANKKMTPEEKKEYLKNAKK